LRLREYQAKQDEFQARYNKAKAIFDERCKTAGEKIYHTVEGIEGITLLNVPQEYTHALIEDPMWEGAALPHSGGGDNYIRSFLNWEIYQKDEEMVANYYDELSELLDLKHDIDVYINNQPKLNYKDLKDKVELLEQGLEKIEEDQTNYSRYLTSLREEESIAREKLIFINQEKEVIKRKLDNSRVPGFSDRFIVLYKDVTDSYRYALEELKKEPINIDLLKRAVAEAEESLDIYSSEVNNILTDIELIEKLIRYANRYRKENIEFHQQLTVAEQYYREYRYNKTLEIIRTSLEKVEPGAYERIRNSVKPR